jgi:ribonuclease P protein component
VSAIAPQEESDGTEPRGNKIGFPRSGRLLRHADFERVYKQGRRHFSATMTVFYWARTAAEPSGNNAVNPGPRVGFTVGKALGGAVVRNRMKRRLREAVRLARVAQAGAVDVVINPKKSLLAMEFAAVLNEVKKAFVVIEQKVKSGVR